MRTKRKTGLFFAVDQSHYDRQTGDMLEAIAPFVDGYKIGAEAITAIDTVTGRSTAYEIVERCAKIGKPVMYDLKLHDVGNTMLHATGNIAKLGCAYFTVHALASDEALTAIADLARIRSMTPLAVTVLTDLDDEQCVSRFQTTADSAAVRRALTASRCGITGFICSALEAEIIRSSVPDGDEALIMTPGVRPLWHARPDEQTRVVTPKEAARAGADYIVVGRPIATAVGMTPADAAKRIREELAYA